MKILCSTNIPFAEEAFRTLGEVAVLPPRALTAERVRDADALVIRSTLRVNRALLEGSRVRFVGTATIGTDHMDLEFLERAGIAWCAAPGCNANSVSEYVAAALLCLGARHGLDWRGKTLGVIGVGNVGRQVVDKGRALGMRVLENDPPRRAAERDDRFLPLETVLGESDVVTVHVPLAKAGPYPTWHLLDRPRLARLKPGAVVINAARGPALESEALLAARAAAGVAYAVLDTWEGEPVFRPDVLAQADLGTPHIAGHSFEGKVMGTVMVYRALCRVLGRAPDWSPDGAMPPPPVPEARVRSGGRSDPEVLWEAVRQVYDIEADDRRLRAGAGLADAERGAHFEALRAQYPMRREFRCTHAVLEPHRPAVATVLRALGFAG